MKSLEDSRTAQDFVVLETNAKGYSPKRGKTADVYDIGTGKLLVVRTDRISALDFVFPNGVPRKGICLTALTNFWLTEGLGSLAVPHHLASVALSDMPGHFRKPEFSERSMLCWKTKPVKFECVVRGYISGSGWKDYKNTGSVCGINLPEGLKESEKLPEPIFTPATKEDSGHDINVPFEAMERDLGKVVAENLRQRSIAMYEKANEYALNRGIIIADTKFEFGWFGESLMLIDEVLTPDSSRFWAMSQYEPGRPQVSYDKQPVRDWLVSLSKDQWDGKSKLPPLPEDEVEDTSRRYVDILRKLTHKEV